MSVTFCLPHPVAVSDFIICRSLCACTEMLCMCVIYVSFGSKVSHITFGCVAMGSALLFIVRLISLLYNSQINLVYYFHYIYIYIIYIMCVFKCIRYSYHHHLYFVLYVHT